MLQSFIIIFREGFESFLIVAVILAYLRKTNRRLLSPAVYIAIAISAVISVALGYVLQNGVNEHLLKRVFGKHISYYITYFFNNEALREGILGTIAVVMVATLVIHMWRTAPRLKQSMHRRLDEVSSGASRWVAFFGVFLFTLLMITREGMETALLLLQVHDGNMIGGALLGLSAAGALALAWARFGHLINLKRFFQVTGIFLLLFMAQVAIYSFHELSEAGVLPNSEVLHEATEKFSPDGLYGQWFSLLLVAVCAFWLLGAWFVDRLKSRDGAASIAGSQASG
jgi:high-affinity iron transporter